MLVREPVAGDQGYVVRTWTKSLASVRPYKTSTAAKFRAIEAGIERLMDRGDTRALIATAVAPDLCGWVVWTPMGGGAVLHYLYVRKLERERGVARALIERAGIRLDRPLVYTFAGPARRWLVEKAPQAVHMDLDDFLDPRPQRTTREARP